MTQENQSQPPLVGWIAVDLDGTLAHYDGWKGVDHIGPPIPKMVEFVKTLLDRGEDVRIFTARVGPQKGDGQDAARAHRNIVAWCKEHLGMELRVTCIKDFSMVWLFDDRCTQVLKNSGIRIQAPEFEDFEI